MRTTNSVILFSSPSVCIVSKGYTLYKYDIVSGKYTRFAKLADREIWRQNGFWKWRI